MEVFVTYPIDGARYNKQFHCAEELSCKVCDRRYPKGIICPIDGHTYEKGIIALLNGHVSFAAEGTLQDTGIKEDLKQNKRTESQVRGI